MQEQYVQFSQPLFGNGNTFLNQIIQAAHFR